MGNSDIRSIAYIEEKDISEFAGSKVVVDGHNWLYKYVTNITSYYRKEDYTVDGTSYPNLIGIPQGLRKFYSNNISPVFVFDGGYDELKEDELQERREKREAAERKQKEAEERGDRIMSSKMESRSQRLNKEVIDTTRKLMDLLNVNYIVAPMSADSQCAEMSVDFDYVVSDDYDALLFGCPLTIRNFTSSGSTKELMILSKTLSNLDMSREQLVEMILLCGTDYNEGVSGVGPATSEKLMKKYGCLEDILSGEDYEIENWREVKRIFFEQEVDEDYPMPNSEAPRVEDSKSYIDSVGIDNKKAFEYIEKLGELYQPTLSDF